MELLSVTMNDGVVKRSQIVGKDNSSEDKSNYKIVRSGDLVYNSMRMWQGANGISKYDGIVSPAYTVLKAVEEIDEGYFAALFKTVKLINEFRKNSQGLTSDTWNLKYPQIAGIRICVPKLSEQHKISSFLRLLDKRIDAQRRLVEALKSYKRGALTKLFPQGGGNVPEYRFAGFTGDWEQHKLGELASLITKGTTPIDKSNRGDVNFVKVESIDDLTGQIKITQKISVGEHNGYLRRSQLRENDILFSIAGTLGRVALVNASILPANTNQALAIIRLKRGCLEFVMAFLRGKAVTDFIKKNPTIGAQPNLSLEQVGNLSIFLPSEEEQQKIGGFFRLLDNLITVTQRKLNKNELIKVGLLQTLFI